EGRAFTPQEVNANAEVAVLGWDLAQKLFDGHDPIGQTVNISGLPHVVIGVVEQQGSVFGFSLDKFIVAPLTSPARRLTNRPHVLDELQVQATDPMQMRTAVEEVRELMRVRRGLKPSEPDNFHLETSESA